MEHLENDCIIMVIGFPEAYATTTEPFFVWAHNMGILKRLNFPVGHAALCLIHKKTGNVEYFDFGRYITPLGKGRVRSELSDPHLYVAVDAKIDEAGRVSNMEEITAYLESIHKYTHGDGAMVFRNFGDMNYGRTKRFILDLQEKGSVRYLTFSKNKGTNCSRFVSDVIHAGCTNDAVKKKLKSRQFWYASPVGNAIHVGGSEPIIKKEQGAGMIEMKLRTKDAVKQMLSSVSGNFTGPKEDWRVGAPSKPELIGEKATWLTGQGEGVWLELFDLPEPNLYKAKATYQDGEEHFHTIVRNTEPGSFDINMPYKFVFDCTRQWISIEQGGKSIRMIFDRDVY